MSYILTFLVLLFCLEGSLDASQTTLSSPQPCISEGHVSFSKDFIIGLVLAISSSVFIGESSDTWYDFIVALFLCGSTLILCFHG